VENHFQLERPQLITQHRHRNLMILMTYVQGAKEATAHGLRRHAAAGARARAARGGGGERARAEHAPPQTAVASGLLQSARGEHASRVIIVVSHHHSRS
jgi:hypothetical protein